VEGMAGLSVYLYSSSPSLGQQSYMDPGLPQKLLPAKVSGYVYLYYNAEIFGIHFQLKKKYF
jgi:hypothetical protein